MKDKAQLLLLLKTLKLSGMLDSLDLRLSEAQKNNLSFSEFLNSLLLDEIETRNMSKLNRLIRNAHIGAIKTLESFDFSFNPSINAAYIRELALCRFVEKGENIFFLGPTGTGKTHLAKALCHQALRKHFPVLFFTAHELFKELAAAEINDKIDKLMKRLVTVDLLAIDDFAFKKISQQSSEYLYSIVDRRNQTKSIIITSNRVIEDWESIFPDPVIANAILDRLAHNAHQFIMKGESYRKKMSQNLKSLDSEK